MAQEPDNSAASTFADKAGKALRFIAYPLGLVAGYFAGDVTMRNNLYKNYAQGTGKHSGVFKPVKEAYLAAFHKITYDHLAAHPKTQDVVAKEWMKTLHPEGLERSAGHYAKLLEGQAARGITSVRGRHKELNHAFRMDVRQFFESLDIKNMWHYVGEQKRNQKVEALVFAGGAAAITIGAWLEITSHKGLIERLSGNTETPKQRESAGGMGLAA